jgi:hypothetical protein
MQKLLQTIAAGISVSKSVFVLSQLIVVIAAVIAMLFGLEMKSHFLILLSVVAGGIASLNIRKAFR